MLSDREDLVDGDRDRVNLEIGISRRGKVALEVAIMKRMHGCQSDVVSLLLMWILEINDGNQSTNGSLFLNLITDRCLERTVRSTHVT